MWLEVLLELLPIGNTLRASCIQRTVIVSWTQLAASPSAWQHYKRVLRQTGSNAPQGC